MNEQSENRVQATNGLAQFLEFFESHHWSYQPRIEKGVILTHFDGQFGRWRCVAMGSDKDCSMAFMSLLPCRAPKHRYEECAELLARINYKLMHGCFEMDFEDGEILVQRERRYTTRPARFAMVFPDIGQGALRMEHFANGFLAEAEMQVSERVTGFKEKRGKTETTHTYGAGSTFSQQPLTRFIRTTGVCWYFADTEFTSDTVAKSIMEAFCNQCGIQMRDLGVGRFHAQNAPNTTTAINGVCIFDNSNGSLRLTERLAGNFQSVIAAAIAVEVARGNNTLAATLTRLQDELADPAHAHHLDPGAEGDQSHSEANGWVRIIAPGSTAILSTSSGTQEVTVLEHFYTPSGVQYRLEDPTPNIRWTVGADALQPIIGVTTTHLYHLMTGEIRQAA